MKAFLLLGDVCVQVARETLLIRDIKKGQSSPFWLGNLVYGPLYRVFVIMYGVLYVCTSYEYEHTGLTR